MRESLYSRIVFHGQSCYVWIVLTQHWGGAVLTRYIIYIELKLCSEDAYQTNIVPNFINRFVRPNVQSLVHFCLWFPSPPTLTFCRLPKCHFDRPPRPGNDRHRPCGTQETESSARAFLNVCFPLSMYGRQVGESKTITKWKISKMRG